VGLHLSKFNPNENVKPALTERSHAEETSSWAMEEEGEQNTQNFHPFTVGHSDCQGKLRNLCVDISIFCTTVSIFEVHISYFAELSADCFPSNLHCFLRSAKSETDISAPAYSLKAIFTLRLLTFQLLDQFTINMELCVHLVSAIVRKRY